MVTASIAGVGPTGSSMPYSVTKSAGMVNDGLSSAALTPSVAIHLMKCLAATQGPKVRVNAVLPGILLTEWVSH